MSSFMNFPDTATSFIITNNSFTTMGGTEVGLRTDHRSTPNTRNNPTIEGINPKLYFRFVKSKFQKVEKEKLKKNLAKLQEIINTSKELGQQAFYEKLMETLAITVREIEVAAVGCDRWVTKDVIDKFHQVYKPEGNKIVFFEPWEKFPRTPPKEVQEKIKKVRELKLFDEYFVLYLDYTSQELKTNKDKIKEKDPILFGRFSYAPDRYYFIVDWIDQYCDLTFDKFVDVLADRIDKKIPEPSKEYFEQVKKEVMDRHERLKNSNNSNFRQNMAEEEKLRAAAQKKKPWWRRAIWGNQ